MRKTIMALGLSTAFVAGSAFSQNAALQWVKAEMADLEKVKGAWVSACSELNEPSFSAKSMATVYVVKADELDPSLVAIEQQDIFFVDNQCSAGDANLYAVYASSYVDVTPSDKATFTQDDLNYMLLASDMNLTMEQIVAVTPEAKTELGKIFQTDLSSGSQIWTYGADAILSAVVGLVEGTDGSALLLFDVGADGSLTPYVELYKVETPAS